MNLVNDDDGRIISRAAKFIKVLQNFRACKNLEAIFSIEEERLLSVKST